LSNDKCKKEWPDRIKNIISVHLARRRPGAWGLLHVGVTEVSMKLVWGVSEEL
jgi:hypothetical protein